MRILVVGDPHFRYEMPYASLFDDRRTGEWKAVKDTIITTSRTCDAVVLMGDNLNARHNHSSVIREFIEFLNRFNEKEIHILTGNHERYGTETALDFLEKIKPKNWFLYTEITTNALVGGIHATMIPYTTPGLLGVRTKEEAVAYIFGTVLREIKQPLAFVHHGVTGANSHGTAMELFNEVVLPKEKMEEHFAHTFAGHIHQKQQLSTQVYMTGNIFPNEVGDLEKSAWIYEKKEDGSVTVEQVSLPVRGIHKINWEEDNLSIVPKHSIVKCYVNDKQTPLDQVKETLSAFDASILIEQYPNERQKLHFEGGWDLSIEGMLHLYADAKKVNYEDLKEGYELVRK